MRNLTGKRPTTKEVTDKIGKQQTSPGMPIVEIMDLSQTAGQTIGVDCIDIVTAKPIMGDRQAEGKGSKLSFSSMDVSIDQWTFPVSAGGRMSQQRVAHDLRKLAMASAEGLAARYFEQRNLVHLAGARGSVNGADWVIPQDTDPDFAEIMVNPVKAPTYNRHFVVDGTGLIQGGQQVANVDSTDKLRKIIDNLDLTLQPIKLDGDESDEPFWLLMVPADVYSGILTDGQLRAFQQNAVNRASAGNLARHPLFSGEVGMWNGILVKKIHRSIRFNAGDSLKYVAQADALTATESSIAVNGSLGATNALNRSLLVGAQALANAYGKDSASGYHYSWAEKKSNYERESEFAVFGVEGSSKLRFNVPDANGNKVPTDHGVIVVDSAAPKALTAA